MSGFFSYKSQHPVETNVFTIRSYFQNAIEVSGLTGNLLEWVWRLGVDAWGWSGAPGMGGSLWRGRGGILYGGGGGVDVRGGVALAVGRLSDPAPLTGFGGGTRLYGPLLSKSTATHRTENCWESQEKYVIGINWTCFYQMEVCALRHEPCDP